MSGVVFLNRTRNQGSKGVVGPVTLLSYNITSEGTPVSAHDADALLAMTEDPCCGQTLPFDGKIKSFGVHIPTAEQLDDVPPWLYDQEPIVKEAKKTTRRRKVKKYEKPAEPVPIFAGFEEPVPETQDDKKEEETLEEVS